MAPGDISLIVGPPNSGRAPALRQRLAELVDRDPVLVVPTGDDAAWFERELARDGTTLGVATRTFSSLFDDVGRLAGAQLGPLLAEPQRRALMRAAISSVALRQLARSSRRTGFVPALDALIAELQGALVTPGELAAAASELDDGGYEHELAELYRAYVELRERAGRSDSGSRAHAALEALAANPDAWGGRPVLVYGFDDFSRAQTELLARIGRSGEVIVAVTYGDRESLKALAPLVGELRHELGAEVETRLERDPSHTDRESLRHLDRWLFEPGAPATTSDGGVVMLECAGELGEAEAVAGEIARLLASGERPDDIVVVARDATGRGPLLGRVLARYGVPAAVEASVALDRTAVGRSLISLCRAASDEGEPSDLLAHLRADPGFAPEAADWLERRIRRRRPATIGDAVAGWEAPPRHLAAIAGASSSAAKLRALARVARDLAESPHREAAPVVGANRSGVPFEPLELRAAGVAEALLGELAATGELPGCEAPDLGEAIEALETAQVALWRGPADGRVRVLEPNRVRAGRARYLFCTGLQEGLFPRREPQDPLLSDERRNRLGIGALLRREQPDWERYLFHACVSRPTECLLLSWQASNDDGVPAPRSPFVDEVLDLLGADPSGEGLVDRRGLDRVTFEPSDAPTVRELARSLATRGRAGGLDCLAELDLPAGPADETQALLERLPDPDHRPGPLRSSAVLHELGARQAVSASSLEGWLGCSYRWFVDHELRPQRLDPDPDPLRLGTVAHRALQDLYAEPPGDDGLPRPDDVGRWKRRLAELLDSAAAEQGLRPDQPPDAVALAQLRAQLGRFLDEESRLETELRPHPDLLEAGFGFDEQGPPPLRVGGMSLRGTIDRIDVGPDGVTALIRDYKTSRKVPGRKGWEAEGKLQLQLYVLAARESRGLDPLGGIYHPLRGRGRNRRPRGLLVKGAPELEGFDLVSGDPCEPDEFERELERAREDAAASADAMRRGEIDRDPLGGQCPRYCTYQAICRIERAVGLEGEGQNGGER